MSSLSCCTLVLLPQHRTGPDFDGENMNVRSDSLDVHAEGSSLKTLWSGRKKLLEKRRQKTRSSRKVEVLDYRRESSTCAHLDRLICSHHRSFELSESDSSISQLRNRVVPRVKTKQTVHGFFEDFVERTKENTRKETRKDEVLEKRRGPREKTRSSTIEENFPHVHICTD